MTAEQESQALSIDSDAEISVSPYSDAISGALRTTEVRFAGETEMHMRKTSHYIGEHPISRFFSIKRSSWPGVEYHIGVQAGLGWHMRDSLESVTVLDRHLPRKTQEDWKWKLQWAEYDLPDIMPVVAQMFDGSTDRLIEKMHEEHTQGRRVIDKLVSRFVPRFPEFHLVIDRYDEWKDVLFIDEEGRRFVDYHIYWPGSITNSSGDVVAVSEREKYSNYFVLDGQTYYLRDPNLVWWCSRGYHEHNMPGSEPDTDLLLEESFDTLDTWLEGRVST